MDNDMIRMFKELGAADQLNPAPSTTATHNANGTVADGMTEKIFKALAEVEIPVETPETPQPLKENLSEAPKHETLTKDELQTKISQVYTERNKIIALMATMASKLNLKVWMGKDTSESEPEWQNVVYIELPTGQISWHIAPTEIHLFQKWIDVAGAEWDNHTDEEKYVRIEDYINETSPEKKPEASTAKESEKESEASPEKESEA